MRRLGKNQGGYFGETIPIESVLERIRSAARQWGWTEEIFFQPPRLSGLIREAETARKRVYLSAGIHGDEPAGPLALAELLEENSWPREISLWMCPCLNPLGFTQNTRSNAQGIDLNRGYRRRDVPEIEAHIRWLERQPHFDLTLCLHEDWETNGFYLYDLHRGETASCAQEIIREVESVCPVEHSSRIEGRSAVDGVIRAEFDPEMLPDWPEAFYLVDQKSPLSYTFEAPSDYELPVRVAALKTAFQTALRHVSEVHDR